MAESEETTENVEEVETTAEAPEAGLQDFGKMKRSPTRPLGNLLPTAKAIRDDDGRIIGFADSGE